MKNSGVEQFLQYYQSIFPNPHDFEQLIQSLQTPFLPILKFKPNHADQLKILWRFKGLPWQPLKWYPYAVSWPAKIPPKTALPGFDERLIYAMNASSLLPALALNPNPGDIVLDACAAPGGKTMVLADLLDNQGVLIANDNSPARRHRMQQLLDAYGYSQVQVWGRKSETIYRDYPNYFDKILVDAPCSSEKHVYQNPRELKKWTTHRIKSLSQRQYALLSGLILALKPGGRLVYSTCAVTPDENEAVISRLLAQKGNLVKLEKFSIANAPGGMGLAGKYESRFPLNHVRRILPHRDQLDPMFVTIFKKISENTRESVLPTGTHQLP